MKKQRIKTGQLVSVYPHFNIKHTVVALHAKTAKGYHYFAVELDNGKTYAPNRIVA
ncbi:MAG: hypothetical protein KDD04_01375 [Sinomicrobium sp.]|nr:hypothetical protein [Sinomicrobium sp.]